MGNLPSFNFSWDRFVSIPEDAARPRFLLKYDFFYPIGSKNFQSRQVSEAQRKKLEAGDKENAREIRPKATNIRTGCVYLPAVKLFSKRMTDVSIIPLTGASCISSFWAD